jgi:probable rRNA maturation factor
MTFCYYPEQDQIMVKPEINISVDEKMNISLDENWLRKIALETLDAEGIDLPIEMGLVITDDKTIKELNKTYRGVNGPTDVLAFHMVADTPQEPQIPFIGPPDGVRHLGDVVISYSQAIRQAQEQGHHTSTELELLIVHGILHLLGYDHESPQEAKQMRARENDILKRLGPASAQDRLR